MDRKQLSELIFKIRSLAFERKFSDLDNLLQNVDINQDTVVLIAYLRASFFAKDSLKHWITLRDKVSLELIKRNLNQKSIMQGLYERV